MSTEEWLKGLKPVQSKTGQSSSQSHDNNDLKGVRVGHSLDEIKCGVSQILVAKDVDILAEDDDAGQLTLVMPFAAGEKKPGAKLSFDNEADEDDLAASSFVIGEESFERRNEEMVRDQVKRKEFDTNLQTTMESVEPVNNTKKSRRTIRKKDAFNDAPLLQPRADVLDGDVVMVGEEEEDADDLHKIISETRQRNIELIRQRLAEEEQDYEEMDYGILDSASYNVVSDTASFLTNIIKPSDLPNDAAQQERAEPMELVSKIPDRPGMEESLSILGEPLASSTLGVGPTLALLRMRGVPLKFSSDNHQNTRKEVQLGYYDEFGNEISAKEAYKQLSHRFHGNKPGKNKEEKRLKKLAEAKRALHSGMDKASASPSKKQKKRPAKKTISKPAQAVNTEPQRKPRIFGMQL